MLTRLYRNGPSRQQISKAYVVAGPDPKKIVEKVVREQSQIVANRAPGISLRGLRRSPSVIVLDTGLVWLHTRRAREAMFAKLCDCVRIIASAVGQAGGLLLGNAVRIDKDNSWRFFLCSDQHRLETSDELETATLCNLLRLHLPVLIAITGRAGADPGGIEALGSRRLSDSTHLHAPYYLLTASVEHLKRMSECLRRDGGVQRMDFLDVYPTTVDNGAGLVEINFNDGQMLVANTRAQALLYQALLIRARRRARNEQTIPPIDHKLLSRNRERAIAGGMEARFEEEVDDVRRDRRAKIPFRSAGDVWHEVAEHLQYEFQVLETAYEEIAPLVQGVTLRRLGHAALQNENDLLRMLYRRCKGRPNHFLQTMAAFVNDQREEANLPSFNEQLLAGPSADVRDWWEQFLRVSPEDRMLPRGSNPREIISL